MGVSVIGWFGQGIFIWAAERYLSRLGQLSIFEEQWILPSTTQEASLHFLSTGSWGLMEAAGRSIM